MFGWNIHSQSSMEAAKGNGKVQHVTKASSDQLLRKFAEMDSESEDRDLAKKELRLAKRRKKILQPKVDATSTSLVFGERKSLLGSQRSVALIPRTAKLRARDIKNRSFLGAIEKVRVVLAISALKSINSCYFYQIKVLVP